MLLYFQTSSLEILNNIACPLALEVGDFWLSRVTDRGDTESLDYHIDNVIPPDEYAQGNDSAYTNAAAGKALSFAAEFCCDGGDERLADKAEVYRFISEGLVVPYDAVNDFHPEYENYGGGMTKQADVILLNYPLEYDMDESTIKNDLTYYSTRTDPNGPAMTWGAFAIGHLSIDEEEAAAPLFRQSYELNAKKPFLVWTETPDGGAINFATGMGKCGV